MLKQYRLKVFSMTKQLNDKEQPNGEGLAQSRMTAQDKHSTKPKM